jgi:hypothetical protein
MEVLQRKQMAELVNESPDGRGAGIDHNNQIRQMRLRSEAFQHPAQVVGPVLGRYNETDRFHKGTLRLVSANARAASDFNQQLIAPAFYLTNSRSFAAAANPCEKR